MTLDEALSAGDGSVFVDFDYTLFGSSSTEEYLRAARPGILVSCVLALLRDYVPWRVFLGPLGFRVRDYLAVAIVTMLAPWNLYLWRRHAPALFASKSAHAVAEALKGVAPDRIVIVSFALDALVAPLLKGSPWEGCRRICVPAVPSPRRLLRGKLDALRACFTADEIAGAVAISDSEDDRDLLRAVRRGVLVPATGPVITAEESFYFPLRYTARAKYGRFYVLYNSLLRELPILVFATWPAGGLTLFRALAVLFLFVSVLAIYEIGYFENDQVAARLEVAPTLHPDSGHWTGFPLPIHAWLWGLVLGLIGALFMVLDRGAGQMDGMRLALTFGIWLLVLAAIRIVFRVYNSRPVQHRIMLYPVLQAVKSFGPLLVLPGNIFGVALLFAQVVAQWITYAIYRAGGDKTVVSRDYVRLVLFCVLLVGLLLVLLVAEVEAQAMVLMLIAVWIVLFHLARWGFLLLRSARSMS